jgi:hypothetical protein
VKDIDKRQVFSIAFYCSISGGSIQKIITSKPKLDNGSNQATPNLLIPTAVEVGLSGFSGGVNSAFTYITIPGLPVPAATCQFQAKDSPSKENARAATPISQLVRQ